MARGSMQTGYLDQQFALAEALHTLWYLADAQLRADVERVVGAYMEQQPRFKPFARIVTAAYTPPLSPSLVHDYQLTSALRTACQLASDTLRADIELIMHAYRQRRATRSGAAPMMLGHFN